MYQFISMVNNVTNELIGACLVEAETVPDGMEKIIRLNLVPEGVELHIAVTSLEVNQERIELDKFYTSEQMIELGYQKTST